ncbi:cation:proton antiporter [Iodidimonas muriae]|uniref:Cation:proton antiporter n=1 Tax=Iodidimonas muriae TaxID=261467 RepID=A0ABQ2L609_9PROT|nr:DUF4040 domain-containing protein [Iodidimonas muriae]GER06395.1 cation:proton antiporter [Kordiimonadales bacterium JCM 17843]GGO04591.1 cation:proton antiporter [Iodidimonas muriae]
MIIVFSLFLLTMMVVVALAVVETRNLFAAAMLTGIFSFLMAANFFVLDAADVALTEAAVGAGVATVFFLGAIALSSEHEHSASRKFGLALLAVASTAVVILLGTMEFPILGDGSAPVHQHVAPWYLEKTPELIHVPNVVTAVLASFRGYDTLGEVFVVLTAAIGVLSLLGFPRNNSEENAVNDGLSHQKILHIVGKLLIPLIILFGLYVQFHGDFGPGGGFQAGTIIAAALILYALLSGGDRARRQMPPRLLFGMACLGAFIYAGVGGTTLLLGGNLLDYSVLSHDPVHGQHLGIMLIEFGVGLAVASVMLTIYHAFAGHEHR